VSWPSPLTPDYLPKRQNSYGETVSRKTFSTPLLHRQATTVSVRTANLLWRQGFRNATHFAVIERSASQRA